MKRPKSYDILEADPDISIKGGWWCRKKDCNTICAKKYQKIPTVLDLGQMRPCTSQDMKHIIWVLKEVVLAGLHRQSCIM